MVLKLYGYPASASIQRVAAVLNEIKVPFEFIVVDLLKGEHKAPKYIEASQPFGQIPVLDDDGFILYESRPIIRYICARYPKQGAALIPSDIRSLARMEQAASVEAAHFDPSSSKAISEKVYGPMFGATPNESKLAAELENLNAKLEVYETILSKQKYMASDELTIVDFFYLPDAVLLPAAGCDAMETKPNLFRWWKVVSSRPSWSAVKDGVSSAEKF